MALCGEVVYFIRLHLLNNARQAAGIRHVAIVQYEVAIADVGILIQVIDAISIEQGGAAFDAMHDVIFFQQKLCQIGAVLTGNAGD